MQCWVPQLIYISFTGRFYYWYRIHNQVIQFVLLKKAQTIIEISNDYQKNKNEIFVHLTMLFKTMLFYGAEIEIKDESSLWLSDGVGLGHCVGPVHLTTLLC